MAALPDVEDLAIGVSQVSLEDPPPEGLDLLLAEGVAGIERPLQSTTFGGGPRQDRERTGSDQAFKKMMNKNRHFFNRPVLSRSKLSFRDLNILLEEIREKEAYDNSLRREFFIKLLQTKLLTADGPVFGTVQSILNDEVFDLETSNDCSKALTLLLDLLEEIMARIPGFRNTFQTIVSFKSLLELVPETLTSKSFRERFNNLKIQLQNPETIEKHLLSAGNKTWSADSSYLYEPSMPCLEDVITQELDLKYQNIIKGPYQSTNHYLETWFRLMQEDFLSPLRKAINEYKETSDVHDEQAIKSLLLDTGYHYCFTNILDHGRAHGETVYLMKFSLEGLRHVEWDETDRMKPGSLLAFSSNQFRTAQYALVCHNEERPAGVGQVWIRMFDDSKPSIDTRLHAIEPMAFYEPYRVVLQRLQYRGRQTVLGAPFPFEKYLVECDTKVQPPAYMPEGTQITLRKSGISRTFPDIATQFAHRIATQFAHGIATQFAHGIATGIESNTARTGQVTEYGLNMDESQMAALNHALTHELAIIQGPPGCGKSFIGAEIVNILILNESLWQMHGSGCILMMAFTNHAIDQFILECEKRGTDMSGTVRIGSRGDKSTEQYLLKNKRQILKNQFYTRELMRGAAELYRAKATLNNNIKRYEHIVQASYSEMDIPEKFMGYVVFRKLREHYLPAHRSDSNFVVSPLMKKALTYWMNGIDEMVQLNEDCLEEDDKLVEDDDRETFPSMDGVEALAEGDAQVLSISLFNIDVEDRKRLYVTWCERAKTEAKHELDTLRSRKIELSDELHGIQRQMDIETVRQCNIVAITTTGASKHEHLLEAVNPTIVIVEEAAEVLESHIVAPLTVGCKHLIMIGDHQQLRPGISEFQLEERNLSISLLERLILNNFPHVQLNCQHRMHPDIASILVPHIYPKLENHPVVHGHPQIDGIVKRMSFLEHENPEEQIGEKSSRHNEFEARYLVALCRYLLLQGYGENDISIICTYAGQVTLIKEFISQLSESHPEPMYPIHERLMMLQKEFQDLHDFVKKPHSYLNDRAKNWYIKRKMEYENRRRLLHIPRSKISDVLVTTVDNYQGEENKIILLSFVRSNPRDNIGFLKKANRICVALSRAKHGFYGVGNFKSFARNNKSDLWKNLCRQMKSEPDSRLSDTLQIRCKVHGTVRYVKDGPTLLEAAPDGGCDQKCGRQLGCGHECLRFCHFYDKDHQLYVCMVKCTGSLSCGHACPKICHQLSDDERFFVQGDSSTFRKCSECAKRINCKEIVEVLDNRCGHINGLPCSTDHENNPCGTRVSTILSCGHDKYVRCHELSDLSNVKCTATVTETLSCGHEIVRRCYQDTSCMECN